MQDSPAATQFIDKLIEQKGLQKLDEEVRVQLRNDLLQRLEDNFNRKLLEALGPDQLGRFESLVDTKQFDKLQSFLYNEHINVQGIMAKVMVDFQAMYLGS